MALSTVSSPGCGELQRCNSSESCSRRTSRRPRPVRTARYPRRLGERWRPERVTALAPGSASAVAGRRLAIPTPRSDVSEALTLLWRACQGSGSTPYSVVVDVSEPSYRCSCPSRKFPCKHVLALLYPVSYTHLRAHETRHDLV